MLRNMSLLNTRLPGLLPNVERTPTRTRLPGLLPNVECTPARMACIAIDDDLSTYCTALAIFCGGLPCNNVLRMFPTV